MAKTIKIKASERVKIINRSFSSVSMKYKFQAQPLGSDKLDGEIEIAVRQVFFAQAIKRYPLEEANEVEAGLWDTFVSVYVTANSDLEITGLNKNLGMSKWFWLLIAFIIVFSIILALLSL